MLTCTGGSEMTSQSSSDAEYAADSRADSVTDDSVTADNTPTENVGESSSSVNVRPKRHSMAMAIDNDTGQDSDDVRHYVTAYFVISLLFIALSLFLAVQHQLPSLRRLLVVEERMPSSGCL